MKLLNPILSATLVAALVVPEEGILDQVLLSDKAKDVVQSNPQTWWDAVTRARAESVFSSIEKDITDGIGSISRYFKDEDDGGDDNENDDDGDHHGGNGRHPHRGHHRGDPNKTIYELISDNKYTTKFAALVDEHEDIKEILQSTKTNRTLFVPTDKAFSRIPPDHKKPPKEFLEAILSYHIAHGRYPARRLFFSHTIPSQLTLGSLGDHHQRLRVSASLLTGIRLNSYSKVVYKDVIAKNGIIHAVDHILVPPPSQAKILSFFPGIFSTFSLGLEKTGLGNDLADGPPQHGGTLFASTNRAWRRLGPRANAFLFSERGKKYLRALLEYQIVVNQTLYSDAFYKKEHDHDHDHSEGDDGLVSSSGGYWHVDLPSLLHDKPISVDVRRFRRFISIVVNGGIRVAFADLAAKDGVIHIVEHVLIPPRQPGHHAGADLHGDDGEISEEDLKARLEPYLDNGRPVEEGGMGDL